MTTLTALLALGLSVKATTYGWGEWNCGDPGKARPCTSGAVTSSGIVFETEAPSAAITVPLEMRFKPFWLKLRGKGMNQCAWILINDKKNPRYIGHTHGGLDMSPGALKALGIDGKGGMWTGRLELCDEETR